MNDLVNHAKTYDMLNHDDDYFAARPMDTLYRDKDNVWWVSIAGSRGAVPPGEGGKEGGKWRG